MNAIETRGLTKQYGDVTAVDTLDLVVDEGTVFGFLGPNGAGKSTVINCVLGYIRPTDGHISVLASVPIGVRWATSSGMIPSDRCPHFGHPQYASPGPRITTLRDSDGRYV